MRNGNQVRCYHRRKLENAELAGASSPPLEVLVALRLSANRSMVHTSGVHHPWGISSVGRALAWHARGHRFEPGILHQNSFYADCRCAGKKVATRACSLLYSDVAQLVEQWTVNPRVAGSSPAVGAIHGRLAQLVERVPYKD